MRLLSEQSEGYTLEALGLRDETLERVETSIKNQ